MLRGLVTLGFILLAFGLVSEGQAEVWTTTQQWDEQWEKEYSQWVSSYEVHEKLFVDQRSPYYGVKADCADAAHALRIIFSYKNGLPFAAQNPSGVRSSNDPYKNFHNEIDRFDRVQNQDKRVVQFINYLGSSMGSEVLTRYNTFPVKIKSVDSGDIFTYRIRARFGKYIRHVYNIKNVNPTGNFDVIYATQAIKDQGLPMIRRKNREFVHNPHSVWGFRRFRWPSEIGKPVSEISSERGRSNEQYVLAQREGSNFFDYVTRLIQTEVETPEAKIQRSLNNLCMEAQARVEYVQQGLEHLRSINGRCMNYAEYDAYSTPARDEALKRTYANTQKVYQEILSTRVDNQVDPYWMNLAGSVFESRMLIDQEKLLSFCPVEFSPGRKLDLRELKIRQDTGKLSSHPNDTLEHRWGAPTSARRTGCKTHY